MTNDESPSTCPASVFRAAWPRVIRHSSFLSCVCLLFGCQAAYFLTPEDSGKAVKAEYARIGSRRVAVLVWADRATLDVDPHAPRRVCEAVTYDLRKNLPSARFVTPRQVDEFVRTTGPAWEGLSPAELAERLKCDLLLRIDLLEYTSRAGDSVELRKGRVRGTLNLYEGAPGGTDSSVYHAEVSSTYPQSRQMAMSELSDADILREATTRFGQEVARKFYDHEVSYRGPEEK